MAGKGGYEAPNNPAPVSGPGALSQRTDGGPTQGATYISGLPYGQGQQTYNNEVAATMQGNNYAVDMPTPLMAPSNRPNEAITSGVDIGAGPGSASLNLRTAQPTPLSIIQQIAQNDPTGNAELVYQMLQSRGFNG
jgi:hypothetical protein